MCSHHTRIENTVTLLDDFDSNEYIFHIYFDEIDKHISWMKPYLEKFIDSECVETMTLITATAWEKMWKILQEMGINEIEPLGFITPEQVNDYRKISDHTHIPLNNIGDKNPCEMLETYCTKNPDFLTGSKVIFIPGTLFTKSHNIIKNFVRKKKCNVIVINGEEKCLHRYIEKQEEYRIYHLDKYQEKYKIKGELRDILRHMYKHRKLKKRPLVITGMKCIERGITFNTDDFNFTHAFISDYFIKKLNLLLQMLGRADGHKDYVDILKIICSDKLYKIAVKTQESLIDMLLNIDNDTKFSESHFTSGDNKAIPIKITFLDTDLFDKFKQRARSGTGYLSKIWFHNKLKEGIKQKKIKLDDKNSNNERFKLNEYKLSTKRVFTKGRKRKGYRIDKWYENYIKKQRGGQKVKEKLHYDMDLTDSSWKTPNGIVIVEAMSGFISLNIGKY